jgi:hypothetical protein
LGWFLFGIELNVYAIYNDEHGNNKDDIPAATNTKRMATLDVTFLSLNAFELYAPLFLFNNF